MRIVATLIAALALAGCSAFSRTPQQQYEAGVEAFDAGRIREARIAFMNVVQAEPNNGPARLMQARLFILSGDGVAAEAELGRARAAGVPDTDIRLPLAHAKLLQGDVDTALRLANQTPPNAQPARQGYAWRIIGLSELRRGDQLAAVRAFDRSIAAYPNDSKLWLDIARFRRSIGDVGPALTTVDRAVAANPNDSEALVMRGELTRTQYGLAASLAWFDRALDVDSGNVNALLERAATNADLGRMVSMLADSRAALALAPDHPLPYLLQASLAARARMFPLAGALLEKTRGAFDNMPSAMLLYGAVAYQNENYGDAARRLTALVDRQPGNLDARRLLAAARLRLGDAPGAVAALQHVVERSDADSYSLALYADALTAQGQGAQARTFRQRAELPQQAAPAAWMWSNASSPQIAAIGEAMVGGRLEDALGQARALVQAMPGAPEDHLVLGDILVQRGDFAGAANAYSDAANIAFTETAALRLIGALRRAGQPDRASEVLTVFAGQNPRSLAAQMLLASEALGHGDWEEATERYEAVRQRIGNNDAALMNNLAWAYFAGGQNAEALLFARRAYALAPANPATGETFGWTLLGQGRRAEGLAMLLAASQGRPEDALLRPVQTAGN